jgi:Arc/MetJ-type ribon-helix-helix transcriptional regulator
MAKSIRDTSKKRETRGRKKTTGPGEAVMLRLHPPLLTDIDDWIRTQGDRPSRPEAIRRLVEERLKTSASISVPSKKTAQKASTLAAREIENLGDKSQPLEEQQRRKRRLIRGPREFRDIRADQPKQKK